MLVQFASSATPRPNGGQDVRSSVFRNGAAALLVLMMSASLCLVQSLKAFAEIDEGTERTDGSIQVLSSEVSEDGRSLTYDLLTDKDHGAVRFSFKQDAQNQPLADGLFPASYRSSSTLVPGQGVWVTGGDGVAHWDSRSNTSSSQVIRFDATNTSAWWEIVVPQGCSLHIVDGKSFQAGEVVHVRAGQSFYFITTDPLLAGGESGVMHGSGTASMGYYHDIDARVEAPWPFEEHAGSPTIDAPFAYRVSVTSEVAKSFSVRWAASVEYYVDGDTSVPVFVDHWPTGLRYWVPEQVTDAARKPNCTPGLGLWRDGSGAAYADGSPLLEDLKLYNKNRATITFEHGSPIGPNTPGRPEVALYARRDGTAPILKKWSRLLPSDKTASWGRRFRFPVRSMAIPRSISKIRNDGGRCAALTTDGISTPAARIPHSPPYSLKAMRRCTTTGRAPCTTACTTSRRRWTLR